MKLMDSLAHMIKRNSSLILSSTAVSGVATTAYLSGHASFKAVEVIRTAQYREDLNEKSHPFDKKEKAKLIWKLYIPAAASGVVTIMCIVGTARVGNKRALAAQAAFVLTERAYSEYREKVIEEFGEKKDEQVRAAVAQDRVRANPPSQEVVIVAAGSVLCCELYTGRYFQSDMESLRKAQNDLNAQLIAQDQASLEEWYYMIGLQPTSFSSDVGWVSDKMMALEFTTTMTEDGRPCLAFSYSYIRPLYEGMFK